MNSETAQLHQKLIKTHQALARRLSNTTIQTEAEAILREMEEVNFRVMMAGRLLFKETTNRIDERIQIVIEAGNDLEQVIRSVGEIKRLLKAIGGFLVFVDKVLDAIKPL